jgi:hypothetical protein
MRIECSECEMYRSEHCEDCLVTALMQPSSEAVEIDDELEDPLQALARAGLIPVLRFRPREEPEQPPGTDGEEGRATA